MQLDNFLAGLKRQDHHHNGKTSNHTTRNVFFMLNSKQDGSIWVNTVDDKTEARKFLAISMAKRLFSGSTNNSETYRAVAVNDNPGSPLCYQRIGYRTASPISDSNITSQILAQERADYELRQKLIIKSSSTVTVRYNPLLLVNNLITITDDFYELNQIRFLIQGISCSLDYSGAMSLTISNIQNFTFLTTGR